MFSGVDIIFSVTSVVFNFSVGKFIILVLVKLFVELGFDLGNMEETNVSPVDEFDIMFVLSILVSFFLFVYIFLFR